MINSAENVYNVVSDIIKRDVFILLMSYRIGNDSNLALITNVKS